jgi:tellurite resistance protein TerC
VLLLTAGNVLKPSSEESDTAANITVRLARKVIHTADYYDGDKLFTIRDGKHMAPRGW